MFFRDQRGNDKKTSLPLLPLREVVVWCAGMPGDLNDDGMLDVGDLILMEQALTGAITLAPMIFDRADLHPGGGDGLLGPGDLLALQQLVLAPPP